MQDRMKIIAMVIGSILLLFAGFLVEKEGWLSYISSCLWLIGWLLALVL